MLVDRPLRIASNYLAADPLRPLETTRAMINFDMIGRDEKPSPQTERLIAIPADTGNRLNLIGAAYSPDYQRVVAKANAEVGLVLDDRFDHEYALNVVFRSDRLPFVLHNVPAFWWFTGFHPDYHHPSDTAEKIDDPKMTKILKLAGHPRGHDQAATRGGVTGVAALQGPSARASATLLTTATGSWLGNDGISITGMSRIAARAMTVLVTARATSSSSAARSTTSRYTAGRWSTSTRGQAPGTRFTITTAGWCPTSASAATS